MNGLNTGTPSLDFYVSLFYKIFIPVVVGGMAVFVISDIIRRALDRRKKKGAEQYQKFIGGKSYPRFKVAQRISHWLLVISFTMLALTGMPQAFASTNWAKGMLAAFGGIWMTQRIHHFFAFILLTLMAFHITDLAYRVLVRRVRLTMLPGLRDVRDALWAFAYNLGLAKTRPQMSRYTFEEKAEYWAMLLGLTIMGLSGLIMLDPEFFTRFLPPEFIPAARSAHAGEAVLAVLAILVWHLYHVLARHFNKSMITGKLSEAEMLRDHPLELAQIRAGKAETPVAGRVLRRRAFAFGPIAIVLGLAMVSGAAALFIQGSSTARPPTRARMVVAITPSPTATPTSTLPPTETAALTSTDLGTLAPTDTPTPAVTATAAPLSWDGDIGGMFTQKCNLCHNGDHAMNGLNLMTYQGIMQGSIYGPVIIPGNVYGSFLVQVQAGSHPGHLNSDQLKEVMQWIKVGAPER